MAINLLCIESANELFSISVKIKNYIFYKEFINKIYTLKDVIQIIDNIMLINNFSYKDLDYIAYGDYPNSQTNIKAIVSIIRCLSFTWKIPILKIPSLLTISVEAFTIYKNKNILVMFTDANGFLHYCVSSCDNESIYFYCDTIESINLLNFKNKFNLIGLIDCCDNIVNFLQKYSFLRVQEKILPKAFYINFVIQKLILNKKIELQNRITSSYFNYYLYNKYKY